MQAFTKILNAGENVTSDNMTRDKYDEILGLLKGFDPQNLSLTTKENSTEYVRILNMMIKYEKKNNINNVGGSRRRRASKKHSKKHSKKSKKSKKSKSRRH
jgi:hypothetical protein